MLVFILVLAVAALAVWVRVLADHDKREQAASRPECSGHATRLTTHLIVLRVYNSTDRSGLAAGATRVLRDRGFDVVTTANDPVTTRKVKGVGEIRYGRLGTAQARIAAAAVPKATLVRDARTTATVDIALGPTFHTVAPAKTISLAIARAPVAVDPSANPACASTSASNSQ
jgi:LytR cell envelope-related transcriptional attenuator